MANYIPKISYTELNTGTAKDFTFSSEPEGDPYNEKLIPQSKKTRTSNGNFQVQWNYNRQEYSLEFKFQSLTLVTSFKDFLRAHAFQGGVFYYQPHSDVDTGKALFELDAKNVSFERPIFDGSTDFEYNFKMKISNVEDFEYGEEETLVIVETQATIANNQTTFADVIGLVFDSSVTTSAQATYVIERNTDSITKLVETGTIRVFYNSQTDDWDMDRTFTGDAEMTDIDIDSDGQVQYKSSNESGSNYIGTIIFKATGLGVTS